MPSISLAPPTYNIMHKFTQLHHQHTPLALTQPPSLPPTVQKQLTSIRHTNICITVHYGQHPPHNIPWHWHSHHWWYPHIPPALYNHWHSQQWLHQQYMVVNILTTAYTLLPRHQHLLVLPIADTATTSDIYSFPHHCPIASTATSNNSVNMLALHAPATLTSTLLSSYLHPSMLTSHCWFLLCDYAWCGLLKSHTMLDAAFYLHGQSFVYI